MLSKRQRFFQAAEALPVLRCPTCGQPLHRLGDNLTCPGGHLLNVHKKGCVNVLRSPVDSCYDTALFQARRRVFDAGCYTPVVDAVDELLPAGPHRLLDAGCGDGWYINALLARHSAWRGAGVDISRDAIFQATEQAAPAMWCVADLRRLPFADGAFTAVLDVLTPASYEEFRRVLAPEGVLVKVYPGRDYLRELRAARGMPPYQEGQVDEYLREKARVLRQRRVTAACPVDEVLWRDFVWMTPLNQDLSAEEKDLLAEKSARQVTIDLHVALVCL